MLPELNFLLFMEAYLSFFKLIPILIMIVVINSCGEGETAEEWFAFEEIAPIGDIYYAKDSLRENDNSIYLEMSGGYDQGSVLKKYTFKHVDSSGKVNSEMTTVASFANMGFQNPDIVDLAVSTCLNRPYGIVLDRTEGETYFVDFTNETRMKIGGFMNYASFWVDECKGYTVAHAFLAVGGVLTDTTGSVSLSQIQGGGFFTYNSENGTFDYQDDAFDSLGDFTEIFDNASEIRIIPSRGDEVTRFMSAIAFVDGNSKLKILQWRDSADGFVDDTTRFTTSFSGLNVLVKSFDYKGTDLSSPSAHFCAVGEDNNSDGYKVYLWNPSTTYSDVPSIETDYPGKCSVTNYIEAQQYMTLTYPWASYHSAKNELSLVWRPYKTSDIKSMLIDKAKSTNWVFATKVHFISKGQGTSPIMIFYDDNEYLKLAVCKKRQGCTLN